MRWGSLTCSVAKLFSIPSARPGPLPASLLLRAPPWLPERHPLLKPQTFVSPLFSPLSPKEDRATATGTEACDPLLAVGRGGGVSFRTKTQNKSPDSMA